MIEKERYKIAKDLLEELIEKAEEHLSFYREITETYRGGYVPLAGIFSDLKEIPNKEKSEFEKDLEFRLGKNFFFVKTIVEDLENLVENAEEMVDALNKILEEVKEEKKEEKEEEKISTLTDEDIECIKSVAVWRREGAPMSSKKCFEIVDELVFRKKIPEAEELYWKYRKGV